MPNMTLTKTPMPEQAPDVRNKNFKEVSLGYTEEMAVEEAGRCNAEIIRCHTSSKNALEDILETACAAV